MAQLASDLAHHHHIIRRHIAIRVLGTLISHELPSSPWLGGHNTGHGSTGHFHR